ncbi:dihydrofolate reductase family protein [Carnobacterium funditum]|uniref:dihydrofolate reductase family protein n=1 Tax=Carnobacterium funditum TaxID=2752 RepID=UPI0005572BF9|nr:dihydrofolate reductase family protein [Carnobacterium funditum]
MRKVILNLAISLDGRIVDEKNQFDWIHGDGDKSNNTDNQFSFSVFLNACDTLILGKTAYNDLPSGSIELFAGKRIVVLTHSTDKPKTENIEFFNGDLATLVKDLKLIAGKDIWVFGGASVCNSLIKEDLIDEYIIGMIPVIVGNGTRLFADGNPLLELHLEQYTVDEGIVIIIYSRKK